MARSRSRRRRQGMMVALALLVTVTLIVFARDIQHQARGSSAQRASLNRTFASLSSSILADENAWGADVSHLLASAPTFGRAELSSDLNQLVLRGSDLVQRAQLLETPALFDQVQKSLIDVTRQRVSAVNHLIGSIRGPLELPGTGPSAPPSAVASAIAATNDAWALARLSLVSQPGHVTLDASQLALATDPLDSELAAITSSATLLPRRSIAVAAVSVSPAPLPSPVGQLRILPTSWLVVAASVRNGEYVDQPYTVAITIRPTNGLGRLVSRTFRGVAAPLASAATPSSALPVAPGEHAELSVVVSGAPSPAGGGERHYTLYIVAAPKS